jgi:23S rRNA A1618 N6-methylase RlmF
VDIQAPARVPFPLEEKEVTMNTKLIINVEIHGKDDLQIWLKDVEAAMEHLDSLLQNPPALNIEAAPKEI